MPFFDKTINAIKSVGKSSYLTTPRSAAVRHMSGVLANESGIGARAMARDVAARSGMHPFTRGAAVNILGGAAVGGAAGAGINYLGDRDPVRGMKTGIMFGAGAGLARNAYKGLRGSMGEGGAMNKWNQARSTRAAKWAPSKKAWPSDIEDGVRLR